MVYYLLYSKYCIFYKINKLFTKCLFNFIRIDEGYCDIMDIRKIKYKRILLKLSGESLAGKNKSGIDYKILKDVTKVIKECYDLGVEFGIVIGGGNFWRGRSNNFMDRTRTDQIGMLATVMNSLIMADALEKFNLDVRVQTSVSMPIIAELFIKNKAVAHINKGRILIFAGGTGSPYFSTDTAASLRAAEIGADIIFKATNVDGVYDCDPKINQDAKKYDEVSLSGILEKGLAVMDMTAAAMCKDNKMPMLVFNINEPSNIMKAVLGQNVGTVVLPN